MLEDKTPGAGNPASDPVTIGSKLAGIEPVRRLRGDGALYESDTLGRLQFVKMPSSRPSFWHGILPMPDSPTGLKIVCEVERDDPPGADHAACVVAIRRRQFKDAAASLPLIQARLRDMQRSEEVSIDDLRLAGIQLPPKPMIAVRQVLEYRAAPVPRLLFMVVFLHGKASVVHVDSDH
jgi:hypothetical protein